MSAHRIGMGDQHTVRFGGRDISCDDGMRLRDVLLTAGETPHNGRAAWVNCRGMGTCGTCAVQIEVRSGPQLDKPNRRESWRLGFAPHDAANGLRLACQIRVRGDLIVTKHPGFWGQHVPDSAGDAAETPNHRNHSGETAA